MAHVQGSLLAGMQEATATGDHIGVVLVDEQTDLDRSHEETFSQQRVLMFASRMDYPIWLVELRPNPVHHHSPTQTRLRALLPLTTPVIVKQMFNAFTGTNLHALLQAATIDGFVVMGFEVNCCVRQTATGGYPGHGNTGQHAPGAVQHGYYVLTCPQVVRGGTANWSNANGVLFYEYV